MAATLWKWASAHKVLLGTLAVPLVSIGLAAAATSWTLGRPKPRNFFSADGLTRPLSELEAWYSSKNLAHILPNFYLATLLKGRAWTEQEARILLSRAMARHPASMCTIVDKDDGIHAPYWQRLWHPSYASDEQGIIDIHFETRATDAEDDESWKEIGERHEADGFSVTRPRHTLFRVIIVSRPSCPYWELIFLPHHSVFDGRGATQFVRSLLEEWAEFQAEDAPNPQPLDLTKIKLVDKASSASAQAKSEEREVEWPLPLENLIRTKPGLWYLIKEVLQDRVAFFRPEAKSWIGPAERGTILRPGQEAKWIKVPAEITANLRALSRQYGTTVNGALWAAAIFALLHVFRRAIKHAKEPQTGVGPDQGDSAVFVLQTAVDMRSRLKVPSTQLGPMVSGTTLEFATNINAKFWETAKKINSETIEAIPEAVQINGLVDWVPKPAVQWLFSREARPPNGRAETMRISNLGAIEFENNYGSLCQFRDFWFARHGMRDQQVFAIHTVTPGKDREMNVLVSGVPELLQADDLQSLVDIFLQALQRATETPSGNDFTYTDLHSE